MMDLLAKNGIKESIVGWYATHPELNGYSALIQNYFAQETGAAHAIHITVDTEVDPAGPTGLGIKGWASTSLGLNPKPENCVFLPVPVTIKYAESERAGREYQYREGRLCMRKGNCGWERTASCCEDGRPVLPVRSLWLVSATRLWRKTCSSAALCHSGCWQYVGIHPERQKQRARETVAEMTSFVTLPLFLSSLFSASVRFRS
jgi:hypothetical protein